MGYELRGHTADVAIAATGETLASAFAATADGLAAAACEEWPDSGNRLEVSVSAESREALLFDYLDELVYIRDVDAILPVDNVVDTIEERSNGTWQLRGSTRGVPVGSISAREVKAITYADMRIEETETGWETYVVVDV